ncbi:MAG: hypothetical protein ACRDPR_02085, partial [Nocardioidaceae bacterium]
MPQHVSASRWLALPAASVALIVSGFAVSPAAADPGNGQGAGRAEQARAGQVPPAHAASHRKAGSGKTGSSTGSARGSASSGHDHRWQAQADPDGDENGGVDQPGGAGGTIGAQDGDNGSGNDVDCEDDNNGIESVPGPCPEETTTATTPDAEDTSTTDTGSTGVESTPTTTSTETAEDSLVEMTATEAWASTTDEASATAVGDGAGTATPAKLLGAEAMSWPAENASVSPASALRPAPLWALE